MTTSAEFHEWSGIADWFLSEVSLGDGPVDPWTLAAVWGFEIRDTRNRTLTAVSPTGVIWIDPTISPERQRSDIAHELGHLALELSEYADPQDERAASYVAAALLCPRRAFLADLRGHRFDLSRVRAIYGTSWELAARRVADVSSSIITIVDNGSITSRTQSHWIQNPYARKVFDFERSLIEECAREERHIHYKDLARAYYVPGDDRWERVILVVGLEELEEAIRVA